MQEGGVEARGRRGCGEVGVLGPLPFSRRFRTLGPRPPQLPVSFLDGEEES